MTNLAAAAPQPFGRWKYMQPGVSDAAERISAILSSALVELGSSATGQAHIADPIAHLQDLFSECRESNWDGEGATPISAAANQEARALLLLLPSTIEPPEFVPEPSGRIALEWYRAPDHVYLLSTDGTGELEFAGIFGAGNEIHGKCNFSGALPTMISDHLRLFFHR